MKHNVRSLAARTGLTLLFCGASLPTRAQVAPPLNAAQSYAVLGGSTVTNTGTSTITGDLGVSPGSAVTGFPPGLVVGGAIHAGDANAAAAQASLTGAFNNLGGQPCGVDLTGQNLGGLTLTPGVYCFTTSASLTGTLTLNAQGNANAVFVFKTGSTLITASGSSVVVTNGGALCNVFWQVGSSATLGTGSVFGGNILALTSITLDTGASLAGRALARNGAVTLDTNSVNPACAAAGATPTATAPPLPGCPAISISPGNPPPLIVGSAYNQTFTASGGAAPYAFAVVSGALPPGVTLTPGGVLSGTPTANATFTIRATDANACFAELVFANSIPVPTMPQVLFALLALVLTGAGYFRLRRPARA
jgi:hypothetical protein